ncbi:MAG: phosphatidate cytidylyltransferase [Desulfovibrionales bacterium]
MSISPHLKRIVTALIALPVIWYTIQAGGAMIFLSILLIGSVGLWEFYSLFWPHKYASLKAGGILLGGIILYSFFKENLWLGFLGILVLFWGINLIFLFLYGSGKNKFPYQSLLVLLAGQLYLPLMLQFFFGLSPAEILFILGATFASDTGAFYMGRSFGKRKLWPVISPKKTWMGAFGGFLFCTLFAVGFGLFFGKTGWPLLLITGILISLAAQVGDLFESAIKRSLRVKDSGKVLPGHGGILDRIDGLVLSLPVYAALRTIITLF